MTLYIRPLRLHAVVQNLARRTTRPHRIIDALLVPLSSFLCSALDRDSYLSKFNNNEKDPEN
jgi:hypothetical protein